MSPRAGPWLLQKQKDGPPPPLSPGPPPPRWASRGGEEVAMSHFPRKAPGTAGPSQAQRGPEQSGFHGPLAGAPLRGSKQAPEEREQTRGEWGGPENEASVAGREGPGMNYPLHRLRGFPTWRLSQTANLGLSAGLWAWGRGVRPAPCVRTRRDQEGGRRGWEQAADSQRHQESRKPRGSARTQRFQEEEVLSL